MRYFILAMLALLLFPLTILAQEENPPNFDNDKPTNVVLIMTDGPAHDSAG